MRIWDIEPDELCRRHLLGEHRELHGLWNILTQGKLGYSRDPEPRREARVREMGAPGYAHRAPLDASLAAGSPVQDRCIDDVTTQRRLLKEKGCECHPAVRNRTRRR